MARIGRASLNSGDALRKTISRLYLNVDRRRVRDRDLLDRIKFGNLSIQISQDFPLHTLLPLTTHNSERKGFQRKALE
jgi:hypothetical protein